MDLLVLDYRCMDCGSPFVEFEAWSYGNLPLNDSEGGSRNWCGTCEEEVRIAFIDDVTVSRVSEWIEFRSANGYDTLEQADEQFRQELAEQIRTLAIRQQETEARFRGLQTRFYDAIDPEAGNNCADCERGYGPGAECRCEKVRS